MIYPLDSFTESIDKLVDKIHDNYPSLNQVQVYMVCTGLVNSITNLVDEPQVEKQITKIVLEIQETL
jgi:hypothetical protein